VSRKQPDNVLGDKEESYISLKSAHALSSMYTVTGKIWNCVTTLTNCNIIQLCKTLVQLYRGL